MNIVLHYIALYVVNQSMVSLHNSKRLEQIEIHGDRKLVTCFPYSNQYQSCRHNQCITCREPQKNFAAQFCAQRMITTVVKVEFYHKFDRPQARGLVGTSRPTNEWDSPNSNQQSAYSTDVLATSVRSIYSRSRFKRY